MARLAAEQMVNNDPDVGGERGVIINTSSVHGYDGQAGKVAYSATKGAINAMTLPMARDLARHGIRVNAIAPGILLAPFVQQWISLYSVDQVYGVCSLM